MIKLDDGFVSNIAGRLTNEFGLSQASRSNITLNKLVKIGEEHDLTVKKIIDLENIFSKM